MNDSSEAAETLNVLRYLDKVRRLYPSGIPQTLIESVTLVPQETTIGSTPQADGALRVVFFVVSESIELSPASVELMNSIASKGLMLKAEEAQIEVVLKSEPSVTESIINSKLHTFDLAKVAIVMGSQDVTAGEWKTLNGIPVLYTLALHEVASLKDAKREFWGHLKSAIPQLA